MDYTILSIGLLLVFTGAAFFGFPVGLMFGMRRMRRAFEEKYIFETETTDVLDAEIIEYPRLKK